jgi:hypothetical protein
VAPPPRSASPPPVREVLPLTTVAAVPELVPPQPMPARTPQAAKEPGVRFQFFLPVHVAKLVDVELDRRKASGHRGRGKSDYTTIFRELVEKHLR